jgi:hypothetical protein
MRLKSGIGIVALGYQRYGTMAANLALTIKATGAKIPVAVFYSEAHDKFPSSLNWLSNEQLDLFSHKIAVPEQYFTFKGKRAYQKAKVYAYELSPFDKTLMIDADSVWSHYYRDEKGKYCSHDPLEFIKELGNIDVTYCIYQPYVQGQLSWQMHGATLEEMLPVFKINDVNDIYNVQSSVIYFKKGKKAKKFYDTSIDVYENYPLDFPVWNNGIPDELPFSLAAGITLTPPHDVDWQPLAYPQFKQIKRSEILTAARDFPIITMAGNLIPSGYHHAYKMQILQAHRKLKDMGIDMKEPVNYQDKKVFIPARKKW